jgi:hypothetical protein
MKLSSSDREKNVKKVCQKRDKYSDSNINQNAYQTLD